MKNKNGFFTFCFAFIPGAGQMYLGYMKRGLCLVLLACLTAWSSSLLSTMIVFLPVVWMYAFFDTFNLRARIMEGTAQPDDYLFHLGADESLLRLVEKRHHFVGWGLVALGGYALYENFFMNMLSPLWNSEWRWICQMLDRLPSLLVGLALIALGVWLVRGPRAVQSGEESEMHFYGENAPKPDQPRGPAPEDAAAFFGLTMPEADKKTKEQGEDLQ